jgi:hypothetical protein
LELNQKGLVEQLKVPFGYRWTEFGRENYLLNIEKVTFKNKNLKKGKGK